MQKQEILRKLQMAGVIAVIRGNDKEHVVQGIDALITGGIVGIEITFTNPNALAIIEECVSKYVKHKAVIIGAGSVCDTTTARLAILAGAKYIVSPTFDKEVALLCNQYAIPYLPGCMSITEMQTALKYGSDIVKLFPANAFSPQIIKAFKAPLPQLNIMPTGGINLDNMQAWLQAGAVSIGIGGNILEGSYEEISLKASSYINKYNEIKQELNYE